LKEEAKMEANSIAASADEARAGMHGMWASVADAWGAHADYADARGAALAERMLDLAALEPGDRVLELASGPGGLGIAAAKRVAPGGDVVISDVAEGMTSIAAARAEAAGIGNVSTLVLDLEQIDQPDESYDAVLCREGFMFALDPGRAADELARVLRPGGRVALAVWGPRERNPWLGLVFDAVSDQLGVQLPPPGLPGPFALSDAERLRGLLSDAGLADVSVAEEPVPMGAASFDEWWSRTSALAGPLSKILASLPAEAADGIRDRLKEATAPYASGSELQFPGVSLVAGARRP
jgi:SAM-dependent methyltransferase